MIARNSGVEMNFGGDGDGSSQDDSGRKVQNPNGRVGDRKCSWCRQSKKKERIVRVPLTDSSVSEMVTIIAV
jgi:hypothetical protein